MWKDYSKSYLKNNRASSLSIMSAALAATMFLSLLCSIAYNFWAYDVEQIKLEEGDWQGRIVCEALSSDDFAIIGQFANVEKAVANEELSQKDGAVADIYFKNARTAYRDMPLIAAQLGLKQDAIQYNALLLSRYLIHDPEDDEPPMLLALYLAILMIVAVSLILMIRGSFELSMDVSGRHEAIFQYHPSILAVTLFISFLTVIFSAWIPARKLSRMTPLEAIRNTSGLSLTKTRHSRMLSYFFGMTGELAGNALKAQKKSLRISTLSLLLSFLGFSIMICFTALVDISTRYTYFERYQDAWDIMITLKDTELPDFGLTDALQDSSGIRDATAYQKANAMTFLPEESQSDELSSLGGLASVAGTPKADGKFQVSAPIVVLDDASFLSFCTQIGITPSLDGAIVCNRIWDSNNSNFRHKEYVPFVRADYRTTTLYKNGKSVEIPILSDTQAAPTLREEYDNYALVHFIPLAMWNKALGEVCEAESDSYIRIFSSKAATLADLNGLEQELARLVSTRHEMESENRIQERLSNDSLIQGMVMIFGAFCVLLAMIGIANVFSNTLGFLRQRKQEFARYLSIGLTPREMQKMFCIEALVIAGKPLLITLPLTALFVQFAVTASYLDPMTFWSEAPILPIVIFAAAIAWFVALAYYIGGKRLLRCDLSEVLQNDVF